MAIRIVEETNEIRTARDAERFIYFESGCVVFPTGETRRIEGGWEVDCYSNDGRPKSMERPSTRVPASSLPDLPAIDDVAAEPVGWEPYFSKPKDAGKP
jgi:hypothetical protein